MSLTQTAEKEHPLLKRKRYTFTWAHQGQATPTKVTVKEAVAKQLNVPAERVALRHIFTSYGSNSSKIIVHVYDDPKTLTLLEPPKGKKAGPKEKAAPAKK